MSEQSQIAPAEPDEQGVAPATLADPAAQPSPTTPGTGGQRETLVCNGQDFGQFRVILAVLSVLTCRASLNRLNGLYGAGNARNGHRSVDFELAD